MKVSRYSATTFVRCYAVLLAINVCFASAFYATSSTSYNYGTFVSEYVHLDNGGSWTWNQAYSACPVYGAGWHMAGIYSGGGNDAVNSLLNSRYSYFGGLSPVGEDYNTITFIWYAGRYKGELISQGDSPSRCLGGYCNYKGGEPSSSPCGGGNPGRENALEMYSGGSWNDIPQSGCNGNYRSVICERSACTVAADCYAAGSSSVSGAYSPDCTCHCRSGYRGAKCQVLDKTANIDGTDYAVFCESSRLSASDSQAKCLALGSGWNLASIPSAAVDNLLSGLTADTMWTGGTYDSSMDMYKWQYGRLAGLYFAKGPSSKTCLTTIAGETMYCNWQSGSPNRATCGDNSAVENDVAKKGSRWSSSRQWDDLWSTGCGQQVRYMSFCYACERSACSINVDCVAANTIRISGSYYPSCTCTCKTGFGGSRCETSTAIITIDKMEYLVDCASTYISSPTAQSYCQAKGQYWTLASVRSAAANEAIYSLAPNNNIWIGGWFNSGTGCDQWLYGRLAGQKYSCGTHNSVVCQSGMYCNWEGGQPDRTACGGKGQQTYVNIFGYTHQSLWDDTFDTGCGQAAGRTSCYACERGPCVPSDCRKGYTRPLGFFPVCTCSTVSATVSLTMAPTISQLLTTTVSHYISISLSRTRSTSATATLSTSSSGSTTASMSPSLSSTQSVNTMSYSLPSTVTRSGPTISFTGTYSTTASSTLSRSLTPSLSTTTSPSSSMSLTMTLSLSTSNSLSYTTSESKTLSLSKTASTTSSPSFSVSSTLTLSPSESLTKSESLTPSPSRSRTYSLSSTLSDTVTKSATQSRTEGSTSETTTIQNSFSPTYYANTTLVAEFLALLPLFKVLVYEDATIRAGSSRTVFVKPMREALWELLFAAGNRRVRARGVPIVRQTPALGDVGVTGNHLGFYYRMPNVTVLVSNSSALNVSLTRLPSYAIEVGERMLLYTSMRELVDVVVLMDHGDVDRLHLIGTVEVYKPDSGMSDPSVIMAIATAGGGALGGMAPELQGVGALALMGCSDPTTKSRFGAYRVLSPVAVENSYAGTIIGNGIVTFTMLIVQAGIFAVFMAVHPYLRVGRAFQTYTMAGWLDERRWPRWVVWVIPRGALFSLETRRAYGQYINAFRAPPTRIFWTSLPTWTPLVFLVAGLFHPNTVAGCQALFVCMGIAMIAISLLILWQAPLRSHTTGWLDAASRVCLGCVMFCMAGAVVKEARLDTAAANAAFAFVVLQICITVLRVIHHGLCMYVDSLMMQESVPLEVVWAHIVGETTL